jgi:hypothetical protein
MCALSITRTKLQYNLNILLLCYNLFFPAKNIYLFSIGSIIISFLFFASGKFIGYRSFALSVIIYIFFSIFFSATLGSVFLGTTPFRNYTEVVRLIPVLILIFSYKGIYISYLLFCKIAFLYVVADIIATLLQLTSSSFAGVIINLYAVSEHGVYADFRPIGLSGGPGQHGTVMTMMFAIFLSAFCNIKKTPLFFYFALICSYTAVLLAQSQTGFITSTGILLFSLIFTAIKSKYKKNWIRLFIVIIIPGVSILLKYIDRLRYLMSLFEQGLGRHSYVAREEKAQMIMNMVIERPLFGILGYGKDYFGSTSAAMDNEYVFIFAVYGILILFTVLLIYCVLSSNIILNKIRTPFDCMLLYMIVAGVVLAWPSAFITDPRQLCLLVIVFLIRKNIIKNIKSTPQTRKFGFDAYENIIYSSL